MARARIDESVGRAAVLNVLAVPVLLNVPAVPAGPVLLNVPALPALPALPAVPAVPAVPGVRAARADDAKTPVDRATLALATRYLLQVLAEASPGRSVEVRVPPFGAVQAVEGLHHTRGTPPNVVELDGETFVAIATGGVGWREAAAAGRVRASGARSDLSSLFPLKF